LTSDTQNHDEWFEPVPWTGRENLAAFAGILATAVLLQVVVYPKLPKPTKHHPVTQFAIPGTKMFCHPARLYYGSTGWRCV